MDESMLGNLANKHVEEIRAVTVDAHDLDDAIRLLRSQKDYEAFRLSERLAISTQRIQADSRPDDAAARRLSDRARELFNFRHLRKHYFNNAMFGEPAWDMLLALYADEHVTGRQTITRLAHLSDGPMTTALRWIEYLESEGFISRESNPNDARSSIVQLTDKARNAMDSFISETLTKAT